MVAIRTLSLNYNVCNLILAEKAFFMMKYDPVANFAQQSIDIRLQSNSKKKQKIGRRSKGQLISKCPFGVIVSTKKPTKFF